MAKTNTHKITHAAWLTRVSYWLAAKPGNQRLLAEALNIDRRRVSQWFCANPQSVPPWTVAPIAKLTGLVPHTDHITLIKIN